ncbi:uncharacterized protein LTR77_003418 [Saxophila tyrrhenica]|uniref:Glycerophosphocholine acyltransferase 1 n=1 Tax=Saxophila tyrrhenica TaxID=1690608 RepID=A0AAV9PHT2_9PEZI|nr:hypothetical protein LTR77_003418 [Saxophila tyrrhenica]
MPVSYSSPTVFGNSPQLRRPWYAGHRSSYLDLIPEEELEAYARMDDVDGPARQKSASSPEVDQLAVAKEAGLKPPPSALKTNGDTDSTPIDSGAYPNDYLSVNSSSYSGMDTPSTPGLSRTTSSSDVSSGFEGFGQDSFPPVDRLTMFDILENFALPQRLEKMQNAIHDNAEKLRRQRAKLASRAISGKNIVGEWRKKVPAPEEQLDKYQKRMRDTVDRVNKRWNAAKTVTMKEKISFVTAVLNIFISGYLIGGWPEYFHYWYTVQLAYFMPIRWYNYHKIGFHYFLADLCYFVNLLMILSIWFFPQSKRLFISTYCLAMGNNAVAIAMWRNSLVFHSLDKVTSLFIHIMPCATLHVLVHLLTPAQQATTFPAIYSIKFSPPSAPEHYTLTDMIIWATAPYALWQLSYHTLITVRKRSKIAAGRPTSFTWLRKSYSGNFLGKLVLSLPDSAQEPAFMGIQYSYAMLTMLPCPLWFWYRWASAGFLMVVFTWAGWNGATYYIDVFGRRMEKELEALRREVQRGEVKSPELGGMSPGSPQGGQGGEGGGKASALDLGPAAQQGEGEKKVTEGLTVKQRKVNGSA